MTKEIDIRNDWPKIIITLENYFSNNSLIIDDDISLKQKNLIKFFFTNLRWTMVSEQKNQLLTIAYSDSIIFSPKLERIIANNIENAFSAIFQEKYSIKLIPIGDILFD